ncbi:uncharacterized protein LOC143032653 [Oratosquilla oratoria]|uniref:uncharacterized protein LOC143032653 n=1 Tax=Oratosquilla oratoria TaxID=337810 RepID=UPI003F7731E7
MEMGPEPFHQPQRRFAHIHVDILGPIPPSAEHRYLFTIIDRSTSWSEAIPMPDATSTSCTAALLSGWISRFGIPEHITSDRGTTFQISRFGIPEHITSDSGTTFTSQLWTSLGQLLGTSVHHTTAYNAEANGTKVGRFHRTLKVALISRCNNVTWNTQLPCVLLGLRTTPKEGLDVDRDGFRRTSRGSRRVLPRPY